jgi:two-component sensor histidine kinase
MFEAADSGRLEAEGTVEALQAALERERARSREIDHRANNSLQLVSSLLLLLSRRSTAPETQQALKAMHQRIGTIAAVHRQLVGSERPERFDLTTFVREQAPALARGHEGAVVRLDLEPVEVVASQACPLALILNELMLNALTHGAAPGSAADILVGLEKAGDGFVLKVQDGGKGLPPAAAEGFGLTIVKLLGQQLATATAFEDAQPGLRALVTTR